MTLCLHHDYRLRQKQGGEQRAEYFCFSHLDPFFLSASRLVYDLVPSYQVQFGSSFPVQILAPDNYKDSSFNHPTDDRRTLKQEKN